MCTTRTCEDCNLFGCIFYLLVSLHFAAHYSKGVGHGVLIDMDAAEGRTVRSCRHPSLVGVIIQHDCRPHLADTGLTVGGRDDEMQSMRKDHRVQGSGEQQKRCVCVPSFAAVC